MNAIPAYQPQSMDFSPLDDRMDLASSPYPHIEDIQDLDYEFEQMDNAPNNSKTDNIMDDVTELGDAHHNVAPVQDVDFFEQSESKGNKEEQDDELEMAEAAEQDQAEEGEEEILYEEEEDSTAVVNEPPVQDPKTNTQPEHDVEELQETDDLLDTSVDDAQIPEVGYEENTHAAADQAQQNATPRAEYKQQSTYDEQTLRDDGDGPLIDPAITEYHEDVDTAQADASVKAEGDLLLEESFEDGLKVEQASVPHPTDENLIESDPATFVESADQAPANEDVNVALKSQDLHPVRLVYLGEEYSLFPPKEEDSTSFFLSDSSLASEPLARLLESCAQILEGSIGHDDELVIDIPTMGLHICQDSKYSTRLSLQQIVDVYLALNRNESRDDIPPLYCNLSSRICLNTQYKYLTEQAQKGTTFTDIVDEHVDTPDHADAEAALLEDSHLPATQDASLVAQEDEDESPADASNSDAEAAQAAEAESAHGTMDAPNKMTPEEEEQYFLEEFAAYDEAAEQAAATAAMGDAQESNSSHTVEEAELAIDAETSEYFEEAIDEAAEDEAEELQEETEDQSLLQEAVAEETVETQALLGDEAAQDHAADGDEAYDADEFLINDEDEENEDPAAHAVGGKLAVVDGSNASLNPPITPSKTSKRKANEEDDDLILEMDTPEPKRRRPS